MASGSAYIWPVVGETSPSLYRRKSGWRQKVPYTPAPYEMDQVKYTGGNRLAGYASRYNHAAVVTLGMSRYITDAQNKAYAKFLGEVSDRAQLAAGLAEGRQSLDMIGARCKQLVQFSKYVKACRFGDAARTLGMSVVPPGVRISKTYGNNWLEYWFGWKPLIGDIHSAINQIQEPIRNHVARGTGYNVWSSKYVPYGAYQIGYSHDRFIGASAQAEVAIANPNLWLANTLGLINPVSVLWELVPFSFVVDWFANVGQVLGSYTDLYGLKVVNPQSALIVRGKSVEFWTTYGWVSNYSTVYVRRSTSLVTPSLVLKPLRAPSVERALTAVSLLLQQLR